MKSQAQYVQIFSIFGGGEHAGKVAVVMFL